MLHSCFKKLDAIRIELISNTCKVLILPLNYAKSKDFFYIKIGLTGIEPITFRYERNILPLNYRNIFKSHKNCKKIIYKKLIISPCKPSVTKFNFTPIKVIIYDRLKKHKNYFLAYMLSAII